MTREETIKIIKVMCDSYPNYKPSNLTDTVNTWHLMLEEYDYNRIAVGLKAYILSDTSGFAPSVGQLVAKAQEIEKPNQLSELEAWGLVSRALRNGYYGAEEEFNKLPPAVRKAVGSPAQIRNWSATDESSIESVAQSQFLNSYREVAKRERATDRLPSDIKAIMVAHGYISEHPKVAIPVKDNPTERAGVPMPDEVKAMIKDLFKGE